MNIKLAYGKEFVSFSLPANTVVPEFREPEFEADQVHFTNDLIRLLPAEKHKYRNIAIVVSDKTRLCGYPDYLPWLTEVLIQQGAQKNNICFYIAYGTHPHQTEEESFDSYGNIYGEYKFIHHDCRDQALFENCGYTRRGTPVTIRKDILQSTLVITFGAISHHYFAGYGGGRKLIFPGLAERKAIYHNHSLFLDPETRFLAAGCQPGKLDGNPLAGDLKEIDARMPSRISIHGILNSSGKVCRLIAGNSYQDFEDACKIHDGFFRFKSPDQYDFVIASSGGHPKDINFIQAHKSVHHAAAFVKDGGTLVMISACHDKIGSDYFLKYLKAGSVEKAFTMLENNYEGNGGTALSLMGKTKRINIQMLTTLDIDVCHIMGVKKVTMDDIKNLISKETGTMAVIKNASILVK